MITGRSVHNQRIERLWRDLYSGCIASLYHLFFELEEMSLLDPNNPLDLFALHYTFVPYVNQQLQSFVRFGITTLYAANITRHHNISGLLSGSNDTAAQEGVLNPTSEVSQTSYNNIRYCNFA